MEATASSVILFTVIVTSFWMALIYFTPDTDSEDQSSAMRQNRLPPQA